MVQSANQHGCTGKGKEEKRKGKGKSGKAKEPAKDAIKCDDLNANESCKNYQHF